jgi:Flp pilus assembly pilin Flp
MDFLRWFVDDEAGQDLIEYSLLLVFVLIASSIFMQQTGSSIVPVWTAGNATVTDAVAVAQGS